MTPSACLPKIYVPMLFYLNLTAVPYTITSAAPCMIAEEAYRMFTTASAPNVVASSTIRFVARALASFIISL